MVTTGIVQLLRSTDTGNFHSQLYLMDGGQLDLMDGDGQRWSIPEGATILIVSGEVSHREWFTRLLDNAELMLHVAVSAKVAGEPIRTSYDVRAIQARKDVGDGIPF